MEAKPYDEVYESSDGWTEVPCTAPGERARFCVRDVDGVALYFTELVTQLPGVRLAAVEASLRGAWGWWKHGDYKVIAQRPNGSVEFFFWPSPTPVVKLRCTMTAPQLLADGRTRIFCQMQGTADGAYYFDLRETSDGVTLVSRQLGVPRGLIPTLMGKHSFARTHILSELGQFSFPLPKGSGFVGLKRALGART